MADHHVWTFDLLVRDEVKGLAINFLKSHGAEFKWELMHDGTWIITPRAWNEAFRVILAKDFAKRRIGTPTRRSKGHRGVVARGIVQPPLAGREHSKESGILGRVRA